MNFHKIILINPFKFKSNISNINIKKKNDNKNLAKLIKANSSGDDALYTS